MKRTICLLAAAAAGSIAWGQAATPASESAVKNVELTVYLVSGVQTPGGDDVPQDLAATVRQLHSLFPYKGYKLAESFILRGRSATRDHGPFAEARGVLAGSGLHYDFSYLRVSVSQEKPYMVHVVELRIDITQPPAYGPDGKQKGDSVVASFRTDLDLAEGQKTVVGKSSINSAGDALILVIVPKVIE